MNYYMKRYIFCLLVLVSFLFTVFPADAEEKTWTAAGDGTAWSDDDNWFVAVAPTSTDDVLIDKENAAVVSTQTFQAKSISIGGRETSTLTSNDFIYGLIKPSSNSEVAVLNRKGGKFTLKGVGIVTLKGQYKDSEESLASEPSFMFWVK